MENRLTDHDRGRAQCETDIEAGLLQFFWQTRGVWGEQMTSMLHERFGVRVIHAGDLTTEAQSSFRRGYNERLSEYLNDKYGDGSLQQALADIEEFRERRYRNQGEASTP